MRSYAIDSPEAMARVVALALMADGGIDHRELKLIERHDINARLGFDHDCFNTVIQEFCEDMLAASLHRSSGHLELEPDTIMHLLQDIRTPKLQQKLLRAIIDIANADHRLADGEAVLVTQAMACWGIDLCEVRDAPKEERSRSSLKSPQELAPAPRP